MTRDEKREELALDAANFCALKGDPTHAAAIRWVVDSYRLALAALRAPAVTGEAAQHEMTLRAMAASQKVRDLTGRDYAVACLAGADALRRGTWQPIETAPKDGTRLLVSDETIVGIGWWFDAEDVDDDTEHPAASGWALTGVWLGMEPTHWMPLPAAPTETTR